MKTLHLRRHSIKDGVNNTIGPKGLKLAISEGDKVGELPLFTRIFHGLLVRTAQTALAFVSGLGYSVSPMPVILGLGDDPLFKQIVTPEFPAVAKTVGNFRATLQIHGEDMVRDWANMARAAVQDMFDQMEEGETAIGFFHSPTIEFAAYACRATGCDTEGWDRLNDMEGLIFVQDDGGDISIKGKIIVTPTATA